MDTFVLCHLIYWGKFGQKEKKTEGLNSANTVNTQNYVPIILLEGYNLDIFC